MLRWFSELSFMNFLAVLTASNVLMYVGSWALVHLIQIAFRGRLLNADEARPTAREYVLSMIIVAINIAVGIPGWLLWKANWIELKDNGFASFALDLALLLIFFDFWMYALHWLMHQGFAYRWIHSKHHDHVNVNGISLYVMNPAEAIGFGALLIAFLLAHATHLYALLMYLVLNWAYGTMGHSGIAIRSRILRWMVGDTEFHHRHHDTKNGNYGFYTSIWDRLFGTAL